MARSRLIILVTLAVLLLAVAGFGVALIYSNGGAGGAGDAKLHRVR
jgi:hypothetical protein